MYDYVAGKADWTAAGLPIEGTNAGKKRAADLARRDVITCGLDDLVGDVRPRVEASGLGVCVVVNDERIVFGILRAEQMQAPDGTRAEEAMRPGPSTFRPNVVIEEMAKYFTEHDLPSAPITSSDGRLIGLLLREDALK